LFIFGNEWDSEIESIINPTTDIFNNITEFEVIDKSSQLRQSCFKFLGLLKNLKNIKKLMLNTRDVRLNEVLKECLPKMTRLEEIFLTSTNPRSSERFKIIKKFSPKLQKLSIDARCVTEAKQIFGDNVEIYQILYL